MLNLYRWFVSMLSFLILWLLPFIPQIRIAKLEALLYNKGNFICFAVPSVSFVHERSGKCLLPSLYIINLLDGGLSGGSEATSSAVKDLQSKLDAVTAECLTEKEKVIA